MKKISLLSFILISILCIASGCYNNTALSTQGAINLLQNDMTNIASTIRNLDSLYLEDYAINELNPIMNYSSYNNMNYSRSINNNIIASVSAIPYSGTYNLNYSYEPKYIDNVNSLDTTYLISYLQSMQDLFLITSDITAANQILNQLTYDIINDTINVRNNAYLLNYNLNELSEQQIATLQEYSATINNILANIENTSGYITNELNNLYELRNNFYKNTETLNAKYINVLNILENRIIQLQNIQIVLERLNNQLILMSDVNNFKNNNINDTLNNNENSNNLTNGNENNLYDDNTEIINENNENGNSIIDNNQNTINNCHQCQICDICGNCAECEICEICPNCKNQSICDGNCNNINNSENNLQNINNKNNLSGQNNLYNNNENIRYNVLDNTNTQNNLDNRENCHKCNVCEICNNCTNCEQCEICPQCNLPSICNGNCNNATPSQTYEANNNLGNNVNGGLNDRNAILPKTTTPNSGNSLLNNNQTGYSNYNGSTVTPILNNDENVNYKSFSIYD